MENEDGRQVMELQEYVGHKTDEIVEDGFPEDNTKKPRIKVYSDGRGGAYQQYVFDFAEDMIEDQVVPI
jgi:hypothetical protein